MEAREFLLEQMNESLLKVGRAYSKVTAFLEKIKPGEQISESKELFEELDTAFAEWQEKRDRFFSAW